MRFSEVEERHLDVNNVRGSSVFLSITNRFLCKLSLVYSYCQRISPSNVYKEKITQLDFALHGRY